MLGTLGAVIVCSVEFNITPQLFMRSSLEAVTMSDLFAGLAKTPVFGFIIASVGCYQGFRVEGGTAGVGRATIKAFVASSLIVLIVDLFMTRLLLYAFDL